MSRSACLFWPARPSAAAGAPGRAAGALLALAVLGGCGDKDAGLVVGVDEDGDGHDSFATGGDDCDDSDPAIYPLAAELCDGVDNDCDGTIDESSAVDAATFFADADGDGYGAAAYSRVACAPPSGFVAVDGDCNDADAAVHPDAVEACDEIDADCDGDLEDADDLLTFYVDADSDGYGDAAATVSACVQPSGTATNGSDCDDSDAGVNPGAAETWYDGVDQACDGGDDYDVDGDGDPPVAYGGTDCDDTNANINPAATERCNGLDDDCDGVIDPGTALGATTFFRDGDRDDYGLADQPFDACSRPVGYAEVVGDCDDSDATVNPGATELWYDGVDQDCDGASDDDADGDGVDAIAQGGLDCDDADAAVGAASSWWPDDDGDGYGDRALAPDLVCEGDEPTGMVDNGGDCDETDPEIHLGATELAFDDIDQDCDGGDRLDADRDGFDDAAAGGSDCDDSDPLVHPGAWEDDTDGVDNDCDGDVDLDDTDALSSLSLGDDDSVEIAFVDFSFPFCGLNWTAAHVSSNGRLTFGAGSIRSTPTAAAIGADPAVAGYWTDLDPTAGGSIGWFESDDTVVLRFEDVPRYGEPAELVTFTLALHSDGSATVDVEGAPAAVALTGWSCGTGGGTAVDLTAAQADHPDLAPGLGGGAEAALYELWDGTSTVADVAGTALRFCGTQGVDADNDGWTDVCGDPDDSAVTTVPR